jgi:hypothetical protein
VAHKGGQVANYIRGWSVYQMFRISSSGSRLVVMHVQEGEDAQWLLLTFGVGTMKALKRQWNERGGKDGPINVKNTVHVEVPMAARKQKGSWMASVGMMP